MFHVENNYAEGPAFELYSCVFSSTILPNNDTFPVLSKRLFK